MLDIIVVVVVVAVVDVVILVVVTVVVVDVEVVVVVVVVVDSSVVEQPDKVVSVVVGIISCVSVLVCLLIPARQTTSKKINAIEAIKPRMNDEVNFIAITFSFLYDLYIIKI